MVSEYASKENASVIVVCAKMESELAEMNDDDKVEFLKEMGISNSGLDKLIFATYDLLGLQTFFTSGKDECRAWTFNDLKECGSELKVKEAGKMRLEGKEYLMQDGDIVYFRFNV